MCVRQGKLELAEMRKLSGMINGLRRHQQRHSRVAFTDEAALRAAVSELDQMCNELAHRRVLAPGCV